MFEQCILPTAPSSRRWTLPVAISIQAVTVAAAVLSPLIFLDRIAAPKFGVEPLLPYRGPRPTPRRPVAHSPSARVPVLVFPHLVPRSAESASVLPAELSDVPDIRGGGEGPVTTTDSFFVSGVVGAVKPPDKPEPPPAQKKEPAAAKAPSGPVPLGGHVRMPVLIREVKPAYPPLARQARIQGVVRLTAIIARDGRVTSLRVVSGHPLLVNAAVDAVSQWIYQPTLLNGHPVEVIVAVDVSFLLTQAAAQSSLFAGTRAPRPQFQRSS